MQKAREAECGTQDKAGVLILEPDDELRRVLGFHLEGQQWRVLLSGTEQEALNLLEQENPLVLIVEIESAWNVPQDLLRLFRQNEFGRKLLVFTTLGRITTELLTKYKPDYVVYKPFDVRWISDRLDLFFGLNGLKYVDN